MAAAAAVAPPRSPLVPLHETAGAPALSLSEQCAAIKRGLEERRQRLAEYVVLPTLCNAVRFSLPPSRWPRMSLQQRARAAWTEVVARNVDRHPTVAGMDEKEVWALLRWALSGGCRWTRPSSVVYLDVIARMATGLGDKDTTRAAAVVEICRALQALGSVGSGDSSVGSDDSSDGVGATVAPTTPTKAASLSMAVVPGGAGDGATRRRASRRRRHHAA